MKSRAKPATLVTIFLMLLLIHCREAEARPLLSAGGASRRNNGVSLVEVKPQRPAVVVDRSKLKDIGMNMGVVKESGPSPGEGHKHITALNN